MNIRHAAALVLVGWVLMLPPFIENHRPPEVNLNAPLAKWSIDGSFHTAQDCESAKLANEAYDRKQKYIPSLPRDEEAICISTDDPRLKGK